MALALLTSNQANGTHEIPAQGQTEPWTFGHAHVAILELEGFLARPKSLVWARSGGMRARSQEAERTRSSRRRQTLAADLLEKRVGNFQECLDDSGVEVRAC